ncbi:TolC family protein [Planctomycetes bacterium K23_9]|uniref:Outer membrane efflux protein n=1 Tax=Stieleria marina TaxID=1930275 RepID=A0A517NZT4_9BACT|nr:Outer membrane efflux protein [Planctomycetes bacterium K23_9]
MLHALKTCCLITLATAVGCRSYRNTAETIGNDTQMIDAIMREVDRGAQKSIAEPMPLTQPPLTLKTPEAFDNASYRELGLQETIMVALSNTSVLRDLGATVLRSPNAILSQETRSLAQMDPQFGVEAALSAYDAQLYAFGKWQNNDRRFNNRFFGGGANAFQQDTHDYVLQLSKLTPTGAQFSVRSIIDYDANNATGNQTPSAWQTQLQAEARQPLLQGGGLTFNRIAGPGATPGAYNGVLIAKVNTDITNAKFQQNVRDFVSNVTNAYWDLYFSYRDLDAKRSAYERSRTTWQSYEAQKASNRKSGAAEALSREQFYRFESELQDAIAGKLSQRTQNNNSTSGGSFAGVNGVQAAERRLRLLIGLPISDGVLLRPADDPSTAPLIFDWDSISAEAIRLRSELQQQRLLVKRREMEVLAAKNFLMPQLDLVSIYRVRGLARNLAGDESAFGELGSLDFQEYEASLELKLPVGFRQGHLAVRHAKIQLARDQAVLHEQERQIIHDLTAVVAECDRAYKQMQTNLNRYLAASDALAALDANRSAGMPVNLEQLLDAQRRISESQSRYFQSLAEYTLAAKNVQFEKGTLLETTNLFIAGDSSANFAVPSVPPAAESTVDSDSDPGEDFDREADASYEPIAVPFPDAN